MEGKKWGKGWHLQLKSLSKNQPLLKGSLERSTWQRFAEQLISSTYAKQNRDAGNWLLSLFSWLVDCYSSDSEYFLLLNPQYLQYLKKSIFLSPAKFRTWLILKCKFKKPFSPVVSAFWAEAGYGQPIRKAGTYIYFSNITLGMSREGFFCTTRNCLIYFLNAGN